jgi:broad specificity phosphatase PhoE
MPLSERGQVTRAELLADILQSVDVVRGVDVIYASPVPGAAETAEPLANRLGHGYQRGRARRHGALCERLVRNHSGKIVVSRHAWRSDCADGCGTQGSPERAGD